MRVVLVADRGEPAEVVGGHERSRAVEQVGVAEIGALRHRLEGAVPLRHPPLHALVVGRVRPHRVGGHVDVRLHRERHVGERPDRVPAVPDRERLRCRQRRVEVAQQRRELRRRRVGPRAVGGVAMTARAHRLLDRADDVERDRRRELTHVRVVEPRAALQRPHQAVGLVLRVEQAGGEHDHHRRAADVDPFRRDARADDDRLDPSIEGRQHLVRPVQHVVEVVDRQRVARSARTPAGGRTSARWKRVTAPKNPGPAPRAAQYRSGWESALAWTSSPSAVTTSTASTLSHAHPHRRPFHPWPPWRR